MFTKFVLCQESVPDCAGGAYIHAPKTPVVWRLVHAAGLPYSTQSRIRRLSLNVPCRKFWLRDWLHAVGREMPAKTMAFNNVSDIGNRPTG